MASTRADTSPTASRDALLLWPTHNVNTEKLVTVSVAAPPKATADISVSPPKAGAFPKANGGT